MTVKQFFNLRDSGKVSTKTIFLDDGAVVVESLATDGKYFLLVSDVDLHRETSESEIFEFETPEAANNYFVSNVKDTHERFSRKLANAKAEYISSWGPLD